MKDYLIVVKLPDGTTLQVREVSCVSLQDAASLARETVSDGVIIEDATGVVYIPSHSISAVLVEEKRRVIVPDLVSAR